MFVSSLTNSDFSSFWLYANFCHKKHLVFFFLNKLRLFDKNSALFIFQCTMCVQFTQFLPLLRGFYCLTDSLFIISHFRVFVKYFFKLF